MKVVQSLSGLYLAVAVDVLVADLVVAGGRLRQPRACACHLKNQPGDVLCRAAARGEGVH